MLAVARTLLRHAETADWPTLEAPELSRDDSSIVSVAAESSGRRHGFWSVLPYGLLVAATCAPTLWFRQGLALKGVDSFFSLHPQGRAAGAFSLWDARSSAGEPTRVITSLVDSWQSALAELGLSVAAIEWLTITVLAGIAVSGMYLLFLAVSGTERADVVNRFVAAAVAVAWVANPFTLSVVWWHQLLVEFTWAVLPWLLLLLYWAIQREKPMWLLGPALALGTSILLAAFHDVDLPLIAALLVAYGLAFLWSARARRPAAQRGAIYLGCLTLGLAWWLLPTLAILPDLYREASVGPFPGSALGVLRFSSAFSNWPNVLSLTAEPALHQTYGGVPYVPWINLIQTPIGSTLRFVFPAMAAVGAAMGVRDHTTRAVAIAAAACVLVGMFLAKGLNAPLGGINATTLDLPFGAAFRHPFSKFSLLIVPSFCLLFGFGLSTLASRLILRPLAVVLAIIVCGYMALPWWTGSVIPDGGGLVPSARVALPDDYSRLGALLTQAPTAGKTMVLPYSADAQAAFLWQHGIQPNTDCLLQDWQPNRSLICRASGQRYADRVGRTLAGAAQGLDPRAFSLARLWGVDRWLVHEDWDSQYLATAPAPETANAFLDDLHKPAPAWPRGDKTLPAPRRGRDLQLAVRINRAPAKDDPLMVLGSAVMQINRSPQFNGQPIKGEAYFALRDSSHQLWLPGTAVALRQWHQVRVRVSGRKLRLYVDGVPQGVLEFCRARRGECQIAPGAPRGWIPWVDPSPSVTVLAAGQGAADLQITKPRLVARTSVQAEPGQKMDAPTTPLKTTSLLRLWRQKALPLVYAARNGTVLSGRFSQERILAAAAEAAGTDRPVIVPSQRLAAGLDGGATASWNRDSATKYDGSLELSGSTVIVFNQSFDDGWHLTVDGREVPKSQHFVANGFANGWRVEGSGRLAWTLTYAPQRWMNIGLIVGALIALTSITIVGLGFAGRLPKRAS